MPAAIPAAIGAATSIGGALIGSSSAKKAAQAQQQAAQLGIEEQRRQFDLTREDLAPWRTAGSEQLGNLVTQLPDLTSAPDPSKFQTDPGYQFMLDQGVRAISGSNAARGLLSSGANLRAISRYGTGLANQQFSDWWNRQTQQKDSTYSKLFGIAQLGANSAAQGAQIGAQKANSISDLLTQQGNAKSAGIAGSSNAWTGALGNLASIAMGGVGKSGAKAGGLF